MKAAPAARSQLLQASLPGLTFLTLDRPRRVDAAPVGSLSNLLPDGGISIGSFVEILGAQDGTGAYSLALTLARSMLMRREAWAVVDTEGSFYPPAAVAMGYDLKRLILLRPQGHEDAWAFTQLLRSPDISVCFWMTRRMEGMVFRRLQLAAEHCGGLGFVLRPTAAGRTPCWARLRLMSKWHRGSDERPHLHARVLHATGHCIDFMKEVEVAL